MAAVWQWLNGSEWKTLRDKDAAYVEDYYQQCLANKSGGLRVFHCFGNGFSSGVCFDKMETFCNSGRCMIKHNKPGGLPDNHMTYKVRRLRP